MNKATGKLIGIGVGPGDPELITVKAVNTIKNLDIVICPEARAGKGSFAFDIARQYISEKTEVLVLVFPMVHDMEVMQKSWKENAQIIEQKIREGNTVGFITLGDPAVYSTYMYILPYLSEDIIVETIPGITSFSAVAATQNLPLVLWEESFGVTALKKGAQSVEKVLDVYDNTVIMKPSHDPKTLADILVKKGLDDKFVLISKCSTDEEIITTDINDLKRGDVPYLSTLIVKRKGI